VAFRYTLPPTAAITALMQGDGGSRKMELRFLAWCVARGITILDGPAMRADGTIMLDANRNPLSEWATFDPSVPTAAELRVVGQNEIEALGFTVAQVRTVYGQLKTGTATAANAQKALACVMRYLWRDLVNDA
jgi:hypothetical protein